MADTPFPFPWAQAVLLLLVLFAFTAPLLIAAYVERLWLAILLDVISVQSYFVLNEVARDLEDPFIFEPNDLPMAHLQVSSPSLHGHSMHARQERYIQAVRTYRRNLIPDAANMETGIETKDLLNHIMHCWSPSACREERSLRSSNGQWAIF